MLLHSLSRVFNYNLFTTDVEFRITVLEDLLNLTVLWTDARWDTITLQYLYFNTFFQMQTNLQPKNKLD